VGSSAGENTILSFTAQARPVHWPQKSSLWVIRQSKNNNFLQIFLKRIYKNQKTVKTKQ
jgi:hypothetical protein